jgi:hypothetical protein
VRLHRLAPILLLALPALAAAKPPRDVADLVGARGSSGELELQRRGYRFVETRTGDERKWSNWWRPTSRQCITVATEQGRYRSITSAPASDCGHTEAGHGSVGTHPDIGYRPPSGQVTAPSYADRGPGIAAAQDAPGVELGLVCFGDGQRPGVANSSGWTWNSRTRRYDYGSRTEMTQEHFDASLMLQFGPGGSRIRLPKKLIPPLHSRGSDNWWTLDDVAMSPDTITASYRLNGLNKPKLVVDRRSGRVTVVGLGDYAFRGSCDVAGGPRRF